ncbi:hydrogenase nickel incorporation protein HypB [Williamsia sp. 1135]|uniref:hydrogenase nickel incorporation protein HypB n=1 Tax=Williamsia sp. 1135 TaxID=1889262 RepID=UPI000A112539|nr:hydrogenase nickel incorporation protein HypB [Williamsia sp. 1135]ORM26822.1 hydrogenase accessory protein HypB [Williamsia sp. 1135]
MGRFHRHDEPHTHADGSTHGHTHDHGDHSGYDTGAERVDVLEAIFTENDVRADLNRTAFAGAGVQAVNLMSSPGSGKTAILSKTLDALRDSVRVGVIEGDIATDLDAVRLADKGAQVSLINTDQGFGGECHLDAPMVNRALQDLELAELDLVIIENVGNLVCPAEFDVGEHARVMVYSVTEGEDKPLKYPLMFGRVHVVLLNKIDLLPHLDVEMQDFLDNIAQTNPAARVIPVSAKTGEGLDQWYRWLSGLLTR